MILIDQDGLVVARQVRNCHPAHLSIAFYQGVQLFYHPQVGDLPSGLGAREAKRLLSKFKQQGGRRMHIPHFV